MTPNLNSDDRLQKIRGIPLVGIAIGLQQQWNIDAQHLSSDWRHEPERISSGKLQRSTILVEPSSHRS